MDVKIKIIKQWRTCAFGTIIEVPVWRAKELIDLGIAEMLIEKKTKPVVEITDQEPEHIETTDQTPLRRGRPPKHGKG